MSPENQIHEIEMLRSRLAQVEAELMRQKQLQEASERRFHLLADTTPVMFWMSDKDAMRTFCNRAWLEFRGRTLEQELGNGWTEGLFADDRDLCLETYLKAFSARRPFRMQYRLQRANGEYAWVEDSGTPRHELSGEFSGFMGSVVDVSDRKKAGSGAADEAVRMVFSLTERERQVLVLIAEGKSTKEAAARLGISYKTADSHRSRILEKLGVHETASMVRYAIRAGLIEA